ncbi:2-oxoglutarate dehydrogenase-like, mitochondrial isoform X2 [Cylas formicarius]|nr:2-oxoglutarate dehydrogenase-like, mitochondrial isoform X2 [Cylas formicarius]
MHIQDVQQRMWIRNKFEMPNSFTATKEEKIALINSLGEASWFENFLRKRFPSIKRFGIEGCEVIIPCLNIVIDKSSEIGADTFIIGATHRGRVNILANVCQAPLDLVISQFMDHPVNGWETGDVKYHLGTYRERMTTNKKIRVSLLGNPSHLEVVFPLTQGRAKAEQVFRPDAESQKVLPIVIHGDAAICGQGVSWETTNLANLPCYNTGGTVHVIINNRLGFTTEPWQYKSSMESTDLCSVIGAPIFHVNADDPESVLHVSKIAVEWRATFQKDVILDVVGYRRFGHSEEDEPSFTQPLQYSVIKKKKTNFELYAQKLLEEGTITKESLTDMEQKFEHRCAEAFEKAKQKKFHTVEEWTENPKFVTESGVKEGQTGISQEVLEHIATRFSSPPPDSHNFQMHRGLKRILSARMDLVKQKKCDWAMGEALAIGSLLRDGVHVRLTGQDVERGTFSHRHHVLFHEILRNVTYQYLTDLYPDQARYTICNTPLSECGVLGFELGYSSTSANCLVIWEAQFGDFANTAQVIFDTMITSGESKWGRKTGLVCFLPHGMEGPSPEHSSARPERFLQMGSDDPDYLPPNSNNFAVEQLRKTNWIVANCTTTANFFHILRRQIALPFRKPLILLTPKSLLRLPATRSDFKDMIEGTEFQRIISNDGPASKNPNKVANILFCSGKIFYEVKDILSKRKCEDKLPLIRIEQVCPFPYDLVKKECEKYQKAKIVWVQEEHKNGGCWSYVQPRFETVTKGERDIIYIGRQPSASTATGYNAKYLEELRKLLDDVTNFCS